MASKMIEKSSGTLSGRGRGKTPAAPQYGPTAGGGSSLDVGRALDILRYLGYWIVGLVLVPGLSILGRSLWAGSLGPKLIASLVLVVVAVMLTRALWDESRPRGNMHDRYRVAGSVLWLFAALIGTSWLGGPGPVAVARPWADVMWGSGAVLALWWTLGALPAVAGRGNDAHAQAPDTLAQALGLGSSVVTGADRDEKGIRTAYRWRLAGVSIAALRAAAPLLAVRLGIPANGIRIIEDPDNAATPTMIVVSEDVLRKMPPWPGPSIPGGSITEPVRSGLYEDGTEVTSVRYGRHKLVGGATGSGKTESEITEFADILTRRDVCAFWADAVKPGQTVPDFAPAITRVATTKAQVRKLVIGLIAAVEYRATLPIGRMWRPTPAAPAMHVHFEEGAVLQQVLGDKLLEFVATARSVGITITWSMQRPSAESLSTDVRAQFADRACYGVLKDDDADMVLNEATIEAGAAPQVWKDEFPGYQYREAGPDRRKHSMPNRAWLIPPRALRAHVAKWAPRMAQLDEGTARAMGDAWTELKSGAQYAVEHGWIAPTGSAGWIPPASRDGDDETDDGGTAGPIPSPREPEPGDPTRGGSVPLGETNGGDDVRDDETSRDETTGQDEPPAYGTAETRRRAEPSRPERDDEEGEDGMTASEREAYNSEIETARAELVEALGPIDPDLAAALRDAEGQQVDVGDVPDFDLWTGDGDELDYAGRVAAVAAELEQRMPAQADGVEVSVTDLADVLTEVPGWRTVAKPALYRLLGKAIEAGQAEDREHGSYWVTATCPGWLRREVARLAATEGEEEAYDED
jgi:hypothetical protein